MITVTAILNAIEAHADRAIVQELRVIKKEVLQLRPSLNPDDQEHAATLLLKLDRLLSDQLVIAEPSRADEALTQTLKSALGLVDVRIIDHFVVAGDQLLSFAETGLI